MTGFATAFFSRGAFTKIFPRTYSTKTQFVGSKVVCSARRRRRKILNHFFLIKNNVPFARRRRRKILSLFDLKTVSVGLIAGLEKTFSWGKGALGGAGRFSSRSARGTPPRGCGEPWRGTKIFHKTIPPKLFGWGS